jgi:putative ABC transport system permease protein
VRVLDSLSLAVSNLWANPLRSLLTLLSITIAVTAIVAVISVINGLNLYVRERLVSLGPASFEVSRVGIVTNREQYLKAIRKNRVLYPSDADAIRSRTYLPRSVAVKVESTAEAQFRGKSARVELQGVSPAVMLIEPYDIARGRGILEEDSRRAAPVAFIGSELARELFGPVDPMGKEIRVRDRSFQVVGVGAERGSVFGRSRDDYLLIPLSTFRKHFGTRDSVDIVVRTRSPEEVEQAIDEVRVVLRARHHLKYDDPDDFGVVSPEGLNRLWREMSAAIFQVALFLVSISLVVGGTVVMNVMLVSVVERTREIGVRKAVGARDRDIRGQLLWESVVLAASGGLSGLGLAYALTQAVVEWSPLPAAFPWWAPALALLISSAVGIFFGLYPSLRAARLSPVQALRSA